MLDIVTRVMSSAPRACVVRHAGTFLLAVFVTLASPGIAAALTLGDATGRIAIGQPLALRIPLMDTSARSLPAECIRVVPAGDDLDLGLANAVLASNDSDVMISTPTALTSPILNFSVEVQCGYNYVREYVLLPSPARADTDSPLKPFVADVTVPVQSAIPIQSPEMLTVSGATTLRKISRLRYPSDSRARVRFIHSVAAANPDLFYDRQAAYDQTIDRDVQLTIPDLRKTPQQTDQVPTQRAKVQPLTSAKHDARERLYVGSAPAQRRSPAEMAADIERLAAIMNEQVTVEISLVERIKQLELDVAKAKQQALVQQTELGRLQAHLEAVRERESTASHIQMGLVLLLIGMTGGVFLVLRRRSEHVEAPEPVTTNWSVSTIGNLQPVRGRYELDDLLPQK